MFADPERFRTFWDERLRQAGKLLSSSLRKRFWLANSHSRLVTRWWCQSDVDEHRYRFFADVTDIIRRSLKDKLLNAGYFKSLADTSTRMARRSETKRRQRSLTPISSSSFSTRPSWTMVFLRLRMISARRHLRSTEISSANRLVRSWRF